jgi:hypothetical protein
LPGYRNEQASYQPRLNAAPRGLLLHGFVLIVWRGEIARTQLAAKCWLEDEPCVRRNRQSDPIARISKVRELLAFDSFEVLAKFEQGLRLAGLPE